MTQPIPDDEWIQNKLALLSEHGSELREVAPETVYEIGAWTSLKLFLLVVTTEMYTRIIANTDSIAEKYYFDLMAGPGSVTLEDEDIDLIGSPLIAATVPPEPFDELYFFEKDSERASALENRLDVADERGLLEVDRDDCTVVDSNANEALPEVVDSIEAVEGFGGKNNLAFVDNERVEIKWPTIESVSRIWGDLLVNFQRNGIRREFGYLEDDSAAPEERRETARRELTGFFGGGDFVSCENVTELREHYLDNVASIGREIGDPNCNRPVQETVEVRGAGDRYRYDLLYATRETGGGSPYIEVIRGMKERIERMSGDDVSQVIDIMQGDGTALRDFLPSEEDLKRDEDQAGLGDFD